MSCTRLSFHLNGVAPRARLNLLYVASCGQPRSFFLEFQPNQFLLNAFKIGRNCRVNQWRHSDNNMATDSVAGLHDTLLRLSLDQSETALNDSHVLDNPLDLCRSLLAQLLANILECEPQDAYRCIQWPNNLFNGDLTVTLPKLRPGIKPSDFAPDLMKKVRLRSSHWP